MRIERVRGVGVLLVPGPRLEGRSSENLARAVGELAKHEGNLVLDLGGVRRIDSAGLGVLVSCLGRLTRGGGDLNVCRLTPPVRLLFELTSLHRVLAVYNTPEEAVAALAREVDEPRSGTGNDP